MQLLYLPSSIVMEIELGFPTITAGSAWLVSTENTNISGPSNCASFEAVIDTQLDRPPDGVKEIGKLERLV